MARFSLSVASDSGLPANITLDASFDTVQEFAEMVGGDPDHFVVGLFVEGNPVEEMRWPFALRGALIESITFVSR